MSRKRIRALTLSAALVGWSFTAGLEQPWRRHPVIQAGLGTALALLAGAPLGLRAHALRRGSALGGAVAGIVTAGVLAAMTLAPVRSAMRERTLPGRPGRWLAVEIPLGTVWSEETAFRGALSTVAAQAFGARRGRLLQAVTFGLSHVADARATGEPVIGTVAITGLAGWIFAVLAERTGSLAAPMLAHLAINESGAVAALVVSRTAGGPR